MVEAAFEEVLDEAVVGTYAGIDIVVVVAVVICIGSAASSRVDRRWVGWSTQQRLCCSASFFRRLY